MNIQKWLPLEDNNTEEYLAKCRELGKHASIIQEQLSKLVSTNMENIEDIADMYDCMENVERLFVSVGKDHCGTLKTNYQVVHWRRQLNIQRSSLIYLLTQAVTMLLEKYLSSLEHLVYVPRFIILCDTLFNIGSYFEDNTVALIHNTCPVVYLPAKKLTLTKLLQIVAQLRWEECAKELIAILMYLSTTEVKVPFSDEEEDYPSENSSMEVYRKLTGCLTPPPDAEKTGDTTQLLSDTAFLEALIVNEGNRLNALFDTMARHIPRHLGPQGTKISKSTGEMKVSSRTKFRALEYYQEVLWSQVGTYLEHILIWKGIGYHAETCRNWRNWLRHLTAQVVIPGAIRPALHNLKDGLCVHITTVTWDELFRKALVAAAYHHSRQVVDNVGHETRTGNLFCEIFEELVELSNSCEGSNWTIAALEELPLMEQIPILHRLDHSVHTVRLWAENRARKLSNNWDMEQFFRVTQNDVSSCLSALSRRSFANQTDILGPECSVHVMVCANMRAKLVSEVNDNISKLQEVPKTCINILSKVCRTFSLANLKIIFPEALYYKQQYDEVPQYASKYVEEYLEAILRPVLESTAEIESTTQQHVTCLVLDIMCEAWLHHIYAHKIKFSEWGALQLLADFGGVPTWLVERAKLASGNKLLCTESLKRCEGVCRLLLSQPGHEIPTVDKTIREGEGSPHRMPPEMYVPNQTQWLELRASRKFNFNLCCTALFGPSGM